MSNQPTTDSVVNAEAAARALARAFHEAYERLAPSYGYKTREASAVPWDLVPANNRALMTAVAAEVGPAIAAQALRNYANQQHPHAVGHSRQVDYGTGVEYDTECGGCGSSWSETEGGCTERVELLRAANALVAPPGPDCNCHETGAPCNCAD